MEASKINKNLKNEDDPSMVVKLSKELLKKYNFDAIVTTRSSDGISIVDKKNTSLHLPSKAQEVFDVSGAGDTVSAVFTLALAVGATPEEAALLSNIAAGVVVAEVGTVPIYKDQLIEAVKKKGN